MTTTNSEPFRERLSRTVMASAIRQRIDDLITQYGDVPIWFMEPMSGNPLPMTAEAIETKDGRMELWPSD